MSAVLDAFEVLLDAQEEFGGVRKKATVGPVVSKDAVYGTIGFDQSIVAGGIAEAGAFELQMRKSDFPTPPLEKQAVMFEGITRSLLAIQESHGVYTLTVGDLSANQ